MPRPKPVSIEDVLATQKKLNAYGITAVRIPGMYKDNMLDDYKLIKEARAKGLLILLCATQSSCLVLARGIQLKFGSSDVRQGVSDTDVMHDIEVDLPEGLT